MKMIENKIKRMIVRLAAAGIAFCSLGAQAQNIVYNVDRAFGGGTIIGTIETDGKLGPLSSENIVNWSFEAFDGTDSVSISSANSGFLQGQAWNYLSATETELTFDFDGTSDSGLQYSYISFHGGDTFSFDYNLLGNFVGQVEQLVHQFGEPPNNGEHRVDSPHRSGEVVIARVDSPAADCSAPTVSLGELMAGFQAGLTSGSYTEVGPTGEYFLAFEGEDHRGFVVPENIDASQQCENDFILISGFLGVPLERRDGTVLTLKEAIDLATSGGNGFFADQRFEVDGRLIEHMNTTAKIGYLPDGRRAAFVISGIILEPYSYEIGRHSAKITYDLDFNRDGEVDWEYQVNASFKINSAAADQ